MKTKINIAVALSRNYDKISLEFLDEPIDYENEAHLNEQIKEKFAFLKKLVLEEFEGVKKETPKEQKPQTDKSMDKATEKQLKYLVSLGFVGKTKELTNKEASVLIEEFLNNPQDY